MTGRHRLIDELFAAIDAMDTECFLRRLTPTARFRFGTLPLVTGTEAIGSIVTEFFRRSPV